jgi:hypothetical protein
MENLKHIKRFNENLNNDISKFNQHLDENTDILTDKEELASNMGLRDFKIEGIEIISKKPEYRIYGRISGELCYFDIDGKISDVKNKSN